MGKKVEWDFNYDGSAHHCSHTTVKGKHILCVDGAELPPIKSGALGFFYETHNIQIFGRDATLVITSGAPDIVIDGILMRTDKRWVKPPKWMFAFVAPLLPLFMGGAVGGILLVFGVYGLLWAAQQNVPVLIRLLICLGVVLLAWGILMFVSLLITGIVPG